MTYFGFLLWFLVVPIAMLLGIAWLDRRQERERAAALRSRPVWFVIALHALIALTYTTPWDNYLVATGVWWYDPALVTGITIGWVPIEEYTFFVLQPILAGLWLAFLARRLSFAAEPLRPALRLWLPVALGMVWLAAAAVLVAGWPPGTYLGLILIWAAPPIALQLFFGADILWRYRRLVVTAIASLTLYLSLADSLAIGRGIWAIDPAQSLELFLGGVLPIEEFIFFLVTCTLLTFGVVLLWARESYERIANLRRAIGIRRMERG
jgi:lycopene cyclase domain-containing protein